jgi:D-glycero-D-manno-heptose 1,7-bisphosphate phosphatase
MSTKRKAVFLDRDGTLIEEVDFLSRVEDMQLYPYTFESLRLLKEDGYLLFVVTNQSGIGRGLYTEADMHAIHVEMNSQLDGMIDAFYFCPHLPDAACDCRKPSLGMIESALTSYDLDIERSWTVGDKNLDRELAKNAGAGGILVRTGYGLEHEKVFGYSDNVVDDLSKAVELIRSRD